MHKNINVCERNEYMIYVFQASLGMKEIYTDNFVEYYIKLTRIRYM